METRSWLGHFVDTSGVGIWMDWYESEGGLNLGASGEGVTDNGPDFGGSGTVFEACGMLCCCSWD